MPVSALPYPLFPLLRTHFLPLFSHYALPRVVHLQTFIRIPRPNQCTAFSVVKLPPPNCLLLGPLHRHPHLAKITTLSPVSLRHCPYIACSNSSFIYPAIIILQDPNSFLSPQCLAHGKNRENGSWMMMNGWTNEWMGPWYYSCLPNDILSHDPCPRSSYRIAKGSQD